MQAKLKKGDWGIDGYDIPKFNAHFDKPRVPIISNDKRKCFIDDTIKEKGYIPSADYKISTELLNSKKRSFLGKGKRLTLL